MKRNSFTKTGVQFFLHSALGDIFRSMDNGETPPNIIISVGDRSIEIPTDADVWEDLEKFLQNELEVTEQC